MPFLIKKVLPREKGAITSYAFAPAKKGKMDLFFVVMFTKKKFDFDNKYSKWPISPLDEAGVKGICIWNIALGVTRLSKLDRLKENEPTKL